MYRLLEEDGRLNDHAPFQINFLIECFAGSLPSDDHAETFLEISGPGVEDFPWNPWRCGPARTTAGLVFGVTLLISPYIALLFTVITTRFRHEL